MPKKTKAKGGRPPKVTAEVIAKLEEAFALDCTDKEACLVAGIDPATLYRYQGKNKSFCERKELLKQAPVLSARREVVKGIKNNPDLALKYLERKRKKEFGLRQEIDHSGEINHKISAKESLLGKLKDVVSGKNS